MSVTAITKTFTVDGVLTNATSAKLSSADTTYGVKRTDTDAVVVADDTAMTNTSTGTYTYSWTDPAADLTYEVSVEFVYGGETYHYVENVSGGAAASQNLYDLLPRVEPYITGAVTQNVLKQNLRRVAMDFFRETEVWTEDLATITSVAAQKAYTLSTTYTANIHRVLKVEYNGVEDPARPFSKVSTDGLTLTLTTATAEAGNDIDVNVVLVPKETCTTFPAWTMDRWGHAIVNGTIATMKLQADKPWFDQATGNLYLMKYLTDIVDAKREKFTRRGPGDVGVTIRDFV